ncbi:MAG: peptide chain release factor 1 [Clostridia bacterium]|nr:peptide chain release factor 1 [Clostridia bacterium]
MFDKLKALKKKYEDLSEEIGKPEVIAHREEWQRLVKEHSQLEDVVTKFDEYNNNAQALEATRDSLKHETDKELCALLEEEISELKNNAEKLEGDLKFLLLPKDANDDKNVIIEIRAGAGGEEACLFATLIKRMYSMYAERQRWKMEELDINETELGGIKEASFMLIGRGAFSKLKYESGVHRVQRVPATESQGRIHTSTITVAVLPEAEDVEINIDEKDLRIDVYRSGGAGGQHVNKTESAIRITHLPTGIVVECQDERSQIKNKEKAFKALRSKLYDHFQTIADTEYAATRRGQVGTGDRSERIRTYNFPQGRVTDHRIGMTIYALEDFLNGDIDSMIEALRIADQTAKLQQMD